MTFELITFFVRSAVITGLGMIALALCQRFVNPN